MFEYHDDKNYMNIKQIFPELNIKDLNIWDIENLSNLLFSSVTEDELLELNYFYNKEDFDWNFKHFLNSKLKEAISIDEVEEDPYKILEELN